MNIKSNKKLILYIFAAAFFALFYYFLPLSGDDWAWGSQIGLDRLASGFEGYNGRYLGNILIILITRFVFLKVLVCSAFMLLLVFILGKIFDSFNYIKSSSLNFMIAFSFVFLLALPNQISFGGVQPFQIFGSTVAWLSGFTNYVVPSVLILVAYYFIICTRVQSAPLYVLLFFIGAASCLCVEHYTLFCLLFGAGAAAYRYCFKKRLCKKSLSFFLGSAAGATLMFTNSSYRLMQKGDVSENQRAVGFFDSFKNYASYIFPSGTSNAAVISLGALICVIIAAALLLLFIKSYRAFKNGSLLRLLPVICMAVMTLPLLFTNSGKEVYLTAPRCYFLQYFMLVIYFYSAAFAKRRGKQVSKRFKRVSCACFAVLALFTCVNYALLGFAGAVRDKTVERTAAESGAVEIVEYPSYIESLQWASNSMKSGTYLERYKIFKDIDGKEIIFVERELI